MVHHIIMEAKGYERLGRRRCAMKVTPPLVNTRRVEAPYDVMIANHDTMTDLLVGVIPTPQNEADSVTKRCILKKNEPDSTRLHHNDGIEQTKNKHYN